MEIGWTDVGSGGYILVSCAHSNTSLSLGRSEHTQINDKRIGGVMVNDDTYSPGVW